MKIKNKFKFLRAILIMVGIIILINLLIPDKALSHQETSYKTIVVESGDTLWDIAKVEQENNAYYEGKDIRDIIADIRNINNLETSSLQVNQTLEILTY